ncbi:DEAD-box type RNA helicase [Conglomerata obtusa]
MDANIRATTTGTIRAEIRDILNSENNGTISIKSLKLLKGEIKIIQENIVKSLKYCASCVLKYKEWKENYVQKNYEIFFNKIEKERGLEGLKNLKNLLVTIEIYNGNWQLFSDTKYLEIWFERMKPIIQKELCLQKCTFSLLLLLLSDNESNEFAAALINHLNISKQLFLHTNHQEWDYILQLYEEYLYKNYNPENQEVKILNFIFVYLCIDGTYFESGIIPLLLLNYKNTNNESVKFIIFKICIIMHKKIKLIVDDCKFIFADIVETMHYQRLLLSCCNLERHDELIDKEDFEFILESFSIYINYNLESLIFEIFSVIKSESHITFIFDAIRQESNKILDIQSFMLLFSHYNDFIVSTAIKNAKFNENTSQSNLIIRRCIDKTIELTYDLVNNNEYQNLHTIYESWNTIIIKILENVEDIEFSVTNISVHFLPFSQLFFFDIKEYFGKENYRFFDLYFSFRKNAIRLFSYINDETYISEKEKIFLSVITNKKYEYHHVETVRIIFGQVLQFNKKYKILIPDFEALLNYLKHMSFDVVIFEQLIRIIEAKSYVMIIENILCNLVDKLDVKLSENKILLFNKLLEKNLTNKDKLEYIINRLNESQTTSKIFSENKKLNFDTTSSEEDSNEELTENSILDNTNNSLEEISINISTDSNHTQKDCNDKNIYTSEKDNIVNNYMINKGKNIDKMNCNIDSIHVFNEDKNNNGLPEKNTHDFDSCSDTNMSKIADSDTLDEPDHLKNINSQKPTNKFEYDSTIHSDYITFKDEDTNYVDKIDMNENSIKFNNINKYHKDINQTSSDIKTEDVKSKFKNNTGDLILENSDDSENQIKQKSILDEEKEIKSIFSSNDDSGFVDDGMFKNTENNHGVKTNENNLYDNAKSYENSFVDKLNVEGSINDKSDLYDEVFEGTEIYKKNSIVNYALKQKRNDESKNLGRFNKESCINKYDKAEVYQPDLHRKVWVKESKTENNNDAHNISNENIECDTKWQGSEISENKLYHDFIKTEHKTRNDNLFIETRKTCNKNNRTSNSDESFDSQYTDDKLCKKDSIKNNWLSKKIPLPLKYKKKENIKDSEINYKEDPDINQNYVHSKNNRKRELEKDIRHEIENKIKSDICYKKLNKTFDTNFFNIEETKKMNDHINEIEKLNSIEDEKVKRIDFVDSNFVNTDSCLNNFNTNILQKNITVTNNINTNDNYQLHERTKINTCHANAQKFNNDLNKDKEQICVNQEKFDLNSEHLENNLMLDYKTQNKNVFEIELAKNKNYNRPVTKILRFGQLDEPFVQETSSKSNVNEKHSDKSIILNKVEYVPLKKNKMKSSTKNEVRNLINNKLITKENIKNKREDIKFDNNFDSEFAKKTHRSIKSQFGSAKEFSEDPRLIEKSTRTYDITEQNLLPPRKKIKKSELNYSASRFFDLILSSDQQNNKDYKIPISFKSMTEYQEHFEPLIVNEIHSNIQKELKSIRKHSDANLIVESIDSDLVSTEVVLSCKSALMYQEYDCIIIIDSTNNDRKILGIIKNVSVNKKGTILNVIIKTKLVKYEKLQSLEHSYMASLNTFFREYQAIYSLDTFPLKEHIIYPKRQSSNRIEKEYTNHKKDGYIKNNNTLQLNSIITDDNDKDVIINEYEDKFSNTENVINKGFKSFGCENIDTKFSESKQEKNEKHVDDNNDNETKSNESYAVYKQNHTNKSELKNIKNVLGINYSQAEAVYNSIDFNKNVVLIQGPPGTGKTTTIMSLLSAFFSDKFNFGRINEKSRVLICAPSNTAIDEVARRIKKCGVTLFDGKILQPNIIRIGVNSNCQIIKSISLDSILESYQANPNKNKSIIRMKLLEEADIICSTLSSSASDFLTSKNLNLDLLIIDEACQCVETSCIIPLRHNPRKIILIGDPKQLPPTTISNSKAYETSLFQRLSKFYSYTLLKIQYRMAEEIAAFPNSKFYFSRLVTDNYCYTRNNPYKGNINTLAFININSKESVTGSFGYYNTREAQAIIFYLTSLITKIDIKNNIAIITPYKTQVNVITDLIAKNDKLKLLSSFIAVNTVDAFQGQEKDLVIISMVRTNKIGFTNDIRRLNVSLTRAKFGISIFGNENLLSSDVVWRELIAFYRIKKSFYEEAEFFDSIRGNEDFEDIKLAKE